MLTNPTELATYQNYFYLIFILFSSYMKKKQLDALLTSIMGINQK